MHLKTQVGLIECNASGMPYSADNVGPFSEFNFKKVLMKDNTTENSARNHFPKAEIVHDLNSILNDDSIDLVVISGSGSSCLNHMAEALKAGKRVRVI